MGEQKSEVRSQESGAYEAPPLVSSPNPLHSSF